MPEVRAVAFDCDGVLADAGSSWAVIHSHFGTGDPNLLKAFLNKELTDEEFMREDIRLWKAVQSRIHRDELFRCYRAFVSWMVHEKLYLNSRREESMWSLSLRGSIFSLQRLLAC